MTNSLDTYAEEIQTFVDERDWEQYHNPKDLAIGLATEASELLELFRFLDEHDITERLKDPNYRQRIHDEVGDTLFFLVRFAQRLDINLLQAGQEKLQKSREKYPADEYRGDNWKVLDP